MNADSIISGREIVDNLRDFPTTDRLFNLYSDEDPSVDCHGAAAVRCRNLLDYLSSYKEHPEALIVAEAPGPWGCRFTGIPVTSEAHVADPAFPMVGQSTSTGDQPLSEYTARIFWRVLLPFFPQFFIWNAVPYHPFKIGDPMSIRTPSRSEIKANSTLLETVVRQVSPEVILSMGRTAEWALDHIGVRSTYVRHPSQGGAVKFEQVVLQIFTERQFTRIEVPLRD